MITELKLKEVTEELNRLSFEEVGDDHLYTGLQTPMKKDAFKLSDEEKKDKIESLFTEIMDVMGLDLTDDSLKGTPKRVAKMYIENITFYSNCEHHFVPIIGKAHVAYISSGKVIGLSKLN